MIVIMISVQTDICINTVRHTVKSTNQPNICVYYSMNYFGLVSLSLLFLSRFGYYGL